MQGVGTQRVSGERAPREGALHELNLGIGLKMYCLQASVILEIAVSQGNSSPDKQ